MRRLVLTAILAAMSASSLMAWDIVVDKDGKGDFLTVQEAIDATPDYSHSHVTSIHINEGKKKKQIKILSLF